MKNKLIYLLLFTLAAGGFVSCSSDLDPWADGHHRIMTKKKPGKVYTMKLSLGGDFITEYDEPMRSEDSPEGDTFVGINVFRTKIEDGATEEKFGYGVYKYENKEGSKFTKDSSIEIKLYSGYTYRFEATVLTEWTDKLGLKTADRPGYSYPFLVKSETHDKDGAELFTTKLNNFYYTFELPDGKDNLLVDKERCTLPYLKNGRAFVNTQGDWSYSSSPGHFYHPRVKRFYGELKNFDPETSASDGSTPKAVIDMAYQCFGVKIIVVGLPAKTKLTVKDSRQPSTNREYPNEQDYLLFPKSLVFENNSSEDIASGQAPQDELSFESLYSLKDLYSAEEMKDNSIDKSVKFTLSFRWDRGHNAFEDFSSGQISVNPKFRKVIKVTVDGVANTETKGNVSFNLVADEPLTDDSEVVEVTNKTDK